MKVGDKVINKNTAEIGIVKDFSIKQDWAVMVGRDGQEWTTVINNLQPYNGNVSPVCPKSVPSFASLCQDMVDVHNAKQHDYGDAFTKSLDKYGNVAFLTRASDKFGRAETLLLGEKAQVQDEKVTDTLMDLANYCVMMVEYLKKKQQ